MNLGQLLEMHKCGALDVDKSSDRNVAIIGGMELTDEQCRIYASNLGWLKYDKYAYEVIDKTNKFIRGLKNHIKGIDSIGHSIITFENTRMQGTEKYFDRIKLICPGVFDLTILYRMPGIGGVYGIYSSENSFKHPVYSCRSLRQVGEYISSLI